MLETQLVVPNLETSWIGNTWGGGTSWMQDYIDDMIVNQNGHCFTYSGWDEGHNERGEYYVENNQWKVITHGGNDVPRISSKSVLLNNITWTINLDGSVTGNNQTLPNIVKATALGIYHPAGYLIVADDGIGQHVIKFFNVTDVPTLVKTFGTLGGIGAGIPGEITPTKFWGITGVGSDVEGNLYVSMSQQGVILRKYTVVDTTNIVFNEDSVVEAYGMHFMDSCDFDATKNGTEIYGKNEHYLIDYTKPVGQQWKLIGYTLDKDKYPADPRLISESAVKIRYKDNQRFLFCFDQNFNGVNIYKFEDGIAANFLFIEQALTVDDNCNLWFIGNGIEIMNCNGIDNGNLTYSDKTKFTDVPAPFNKAKNLLYDTLHDEMYLAGGTLDNPTQGGPHQGPVICKYKNWNTTKDLIWQITIPWYHNEAPVPERIVPQAWQFAGERLYIAYLIGDGEPYPNPEYDSPGIIRVYNTRDGSFIERFSAGPEVFYGSSWIDVNNAISAFERINGEHVILREEAWKNKNILFSYFPEGISSETDIKNIELTKVTVGDIFLNTVMLQFNVNIEGTASRVELYANNQLLSTLNAPPFIFDIANLPIGNEITIRAIAYDLNDNKGYSNRIYIKVSDGTPEVKIISPADNTKYLKTDDISIQSSYVDYDGSVLKIEYFANGVKMGESTNPVDNFLWVDPPVGNIQLISAVTDNQGRIGISKPVNITVTDLKPSDSVTDPKPGVRYKYYEGTSSSLSNYDQIVSIDMGSQANLSLDKRLKNEKFGFRFDGYVKIDTAGLYTFYLTSDDGSKLYFGSELLINNDGNHGMEEKNGKMLLDVGYHRFTLDYTQGEGGFGLQLAYDGPNISKTIIPDSQLYHEPSWLICPVPITDVSLNKTTLTLPQRNGSLLVATVNPNNTCSKKIVWISDNPSVAVVEGGMVTGKNIGNTQIRAISADINIIGLCNVDVISNILPSPWGLHIVGNTSGDVSLSNNEITLSGSGVDIWGDHDEFAYVNQVVSGDSTLVAKITSQTNTDEWAKAGLMFRKGIEGHNAYVAILVTAQHGIQFSWRNNDGAFSEGPTFEGQGLIPTYLKLERTVNTFKGYISADGTNWTFLTSKTLDLPTDLRVGLAVCAHTHEKTSVVNFTNVSLNGTPVDPLPIMNDIIKYYPRRDYTQRMIGGIFEGSNEDPINGPYVTIHTITNNPPVAWTGVMVDLGNYRYLRYSSPNGSYGNVAEIEFYRNNVKVTGINFGTPGSWNNNGKTFDKIFDGDIDTFFDAPTPDGNYVGIDTVIPVLGPKVISAVSRRNHGSKGAFDIALSISETDDINLIPVECRGGTKQSIVIETDKPIASTQIVVEPMAGKKALLENWIQNSSNSFTINLNTVSDAQLLTIKLNNISGTDDASGGSAIIRMRILTGDVDGDGIVSQNDKEMMEGYLGVNKRSFRYDINTTGNITEQDLSSIKNRLGWKI